MRTYFVHYFADSLFSVNSREEHQKNIFGALEFKFGQVNKVFVRDVILQLDGVNCFSGLDFYVSLGAANRESAKLIAKAYVETLLNLLSFSTLAYSNAAYVQSVIEIDTNENPKHLFEYFVHKHTGHLFPLERPLQKIDPILFNMIWEGWNSLADEKLKSRINRSISWFRKGLNETDIDEFIAYFIGLEILSGNLNKKFDLEFKPAFFQKIKSWVTRKKYHGTDWTGIEKLFLDYSLEIGFKQLKVKRNDIFHGYKALDLKFLEEIRSQIPIVRKAQVSAISVLLDIDPQSFFDRKYTKPLFERWDVVNGHFEDFTSNIEDLLNQYPTVKHERVHRDIKINESGDLVSHEKVEYTFNARADLKFHIGDVQSWSGKDTGIKNIEIKNID